MRRVGVLALAFALLAAAVLAGDGPLGAADVRGALPLLERGELVLTPPGGKNATAMAKIEAPREVVWNTVLDFAGYARFVPRVVSARVTARAEGQIDVRYEVEVPGPNPRYVVRWTVDEGKGTLDGRWLSGDLGGGTWRWAFYDAPGGAVACYTAHAELGPANRLLKGLDDKYNSLTVALDVSSALLMVKAIAEEAERRAAKRRQF